MHVTTLSITQHSKFPLMGKISFISPSMEQYWYHFALYSDLFSITQTEITEV